MPRPLRVPPPSGVFYPPRVFGRLALARQQRDQGASPVLWSAVVREFEFTIDTISGEFRLHVHSIAAPGCDDVAGLGRALGDVCEIDAALTSYRWRGYVSVYGCRIGARSVGPVFAHCDCRTWRQRQRRGANTRWLVLAPPLKWLLWPSAKWKRAVSQRLRIAPTRRRANGPRVVPGGGRRRRTWWSARRDRQGHDHMKGPESWSPSGRSTAGRWLPDS